MSYEAMSYEAMSYEESSCGFWPDSGPVQEAAFYAYAAPAPAGLERAVIHSPAA